jgi:DNA-binding MarR family transcriptional regulator
MPIHDPRYSRHFKGFDRDHGAVPQRDQATALFGRAAIAYDAWRAQLRRGLALTHHERQALAYLWEAGSMSMSELGERLALSRAAMTSLIDNLESLSFVTRSVDDLDRRRTMLTVTELPYVRMVPLTYELTHLMDAAMTGFSEAEWEGIVRFLDIVHEQSHAEAERLRQCDDETLREICDASEADWDNNAAESDSPKTV